MLCSDIQHTDYKGPFINYDLGGVGKLEGGHNFLGIPVGVVTFLGIPEGEVTFFKALH